MDKYSIPKGSSNLSEILGLLNTNDFYFHITLTALIELLKEKKGQDGNPLITEEEIELKLKEVRDKTMNQLKIVAPTPGSIITNKETK
jgi:hypothetical protein